MALDAPGKRLPWQYLALFIIAALLLLSACVLPMPTRTFGRQLTPARVRLIKPGITTRSDIMRRFGIPQAIMEPGEAMSTNYGMVWVGILFRYHRVHNTTDAFFEAFRDRVELGPEHRIYYYYHCKSTRMDYFVVGPNITNKLRLSSLLVLVNEATGLVEEAFYIMDDKPGVWLGSSPTNRAGVAERKK